MIVLTRVATLSLNPFLAHRRGHGVSRFSSALYGRAAGLKMLCTALNALHYAECGIVATGIPTSSPP
jgi:hypothetical protein